MEHKRYTCDGCGKELEFVPEVWNHVYIGARNSEANIRVDVSFTLDSLNKNGEAHLCWSCIKKVFDKFYCKMMRTK